ncbi:MAG: hypothetical protein IPL77_09350 [Flavobacteriales bacterium]|nr:hypothetical protein [Flavobacteriales bacterium]
MVISLESLSSVYDTLRNYEAALEAHREFKILNDSLRNADSRLTIARLEEEFRRDKEREVLVAEGKRKNAESARRLAWNIALGGALFFLLLTVFLLFKIMRARMRTSVLEQEKLRLEREKLAAEQTILKDSLEFKDRELTANALFLLKKNELIGHIAERLLKAKPTFRQENQQVIQEIVRDLQSSHDEHNWKEFEAHFTRVHHLLPDPAGTVPRAHSQRAEALRLPPPQHVHQGYFGHHAADTQQHHGRPIAAAQEARDRGRRGESGGLPAVDLSDRALFPQGTAHQPVSCACNADVRSARRFCAAVVGPSSGSWIQSAGTFAASMPHTVSNPEQEPLPSDDLDRLEQVHQRVKDKQEAWRKLLEHMEDLKKKTPETTEPEKPST